MNVMVCACCRLIVADLLNVSGDLSFSEQVQSQEFVSQSYRVSTCEERFSNGWSPVEPLEQDMGEMLNHDNVPIIPIERIMPPKAKRVKKKAKKSL